MKWAIIALAVFFTIVAVSTEWKKRRARNATRHGSAVDDFISNNGFDTDDDSDTPEEPGGGNPDNLN